MIQQQQLLRSTPEAQGIATAAIRAFVDAVEQHIEELHSFMLLRHGHVVAEGWWSPYAPELRHMLFSLSKSFTSSAVGLVIEAGLLSLDAAVVSFFPDEAPAEVSPNLAAMQVRHLLSMSTGHAEDTMPYLWQGDNWVRAFLARPVEHEPGTHFLYNTGASYMLSAIVQKLTGMTLLEYLGPRLLEPLGIEHATWETSPQGINTGGFGLSTNTEAIARFGQLYLQKGMWEGKRILPEGWVEAASAAQVPNGTDPESDWAQGYGYQFWRCRYGAYRGDGAFGQYCVVMPEQDAVLAITGGVGDMQEPLNLVWKHLLPAMGSAPLPEDRQAQEQLDQQLAHLALRLPQGQLSSATAAEVSGKRYSFPANDQRIVAASFDFTGDECVLTVHNEYGAQRIACGSGVWRNSNAVLLARPGLQPVTACGAWPDAKTFVAKLYLYETPFCVTITARFAEDRVFFQWKENVSFGPTEHPQLEGRRAEA